MRLCVQPREKSSSVGKRLWEEQSAWEQTEMGEAKTIDDIENLAIQANLRLQENELNSKTSMKAMADSIWHLGKRISLMEDICKDQVDLVTVFLIPGHLGIRIDWTSGIVIYVADNCTARIEGIDAGWYVHMLGDQVCTMEGWEENVARGQPFKVSFRKPRIDGSAPGIGLAPRTQGMIEKLEIAVEHRLGKIREDVSQQVGNVSRQGQLALDALGKKLEAHETRIQTQLQDMILHRELALRDQRSVSDVVCLVANLQDDVKALHTQLDYIHNFQSASDMKNQVELAVKFDEMFEKTMHSHVEKIKLGMPKPHTHQATKGVRLQESAQATKGVKLQESAYGAHISQHSRSDLTILEERSEIVQPRRRITVL
jgi:hypothetical protein